jgi:hypothetical protein
MSKNNRISPYNPPRELAAAWQDWCDRETDEWLDVAPDEWWQKECLSSEWYGWLRCRNTPLQSKENLPIEFFHYLLEFPPPFRLEIPPIPESLVRLVNSDPESVETQAAIDSWIWGGAS